jgi:glyoxylase-like metal-dependent hydrolase (beta-lactamase superfamily II)
MWSQLGEDLFLWRDCCNVYAIRRGEEAILVDGGSGAVADALGEIGVRRAVHVLHTHHHRDQCQGSPRLHAGGAALWAPEYEAELMGDPEGLWQGRALLNSYSGRSDRFSPLAALPLGGVLRDYETWQWRDVRLRVLPAPGHTVGSCALLWERAAGGPVAFTGDLLYGPGKVWSMSTYQYDYNGCGGALLTVRSLQALAACAPGLLLPAHGEAMADPRGALAATEAGLRAFIASRSPNGLAPLADALSRPLEVISPHLLRDTHSVSSNWIVLADDGHAVWIDYGYSSGVYITQAGGDPASKRPVLHGLEQLEREFGVREIDAVLVTHHHDDHVAAINALRRARGVQVWAPADCADVLERPAAYKTQCVWYEPIRVDRAVPSGESIRWRGYTFTFHSQPGHTRYAACIAFEADGRRCLAIGDQFPHNYIYANQFALGDYPGTVDLWRRLAPERILPGHGPAQDGPEWIARFAAEAEGVDDFHRRLLPLDEVDFGAGGQAAEVYPYHAAVAAGTSVDVRVRARNPFGREAPLVVRLALPAGWAAEPEVARADAAPRAEVEFRFRLAPAAAPVRRARYAVDLTAGGRPFGQVEEGFVTVLPAEG